MRERMLCLLDALEEERLAPFPWASPAGLSQGPALPTLACGGASLATVPTWLIVTFQPSLAADCPLLGSSKLQETNKMNPNEWMALQ